MADDRAITLIVAGGTDVGKKRQRNEDTVRWYLPDADGPLADFGTVLLVCDGMGGVGQGDVASQTAVEQFFNVFYDTTIDEPDTEKRIQKALETAHDHVREAAASLGRLYIGTTAAGMVLRNDGSAVAFNLGDSRVYRLRGDTFTMISKDQSVNAAQLERGEITPEQAAVARNNNITMFIGHPLEMTPVYVHQRVEPGDVFMLCSDGLWDVLPEPQLKDILANQPPEQAVKTYIDRTLRAGAPDNVTVIIASTRQHKPRRKWWPLGLLGLLVAGIGAALLAGQIANNSQTGSSTDVAFVALTEIQTAEPSATGEESEPDAVPSESDTTTSLIPLEVLPSNTARPTETPTDPPPPSDTPTNTASPTASDTPTETTTPTGTVTRRPTQTATSSPTVTPSPTTSSTAAPRATRTPSATRTATNTPTSTSTATDTATYTPTASQTPTRTALPTNTASATAAPTDTATYTATNLPTGTPQPTSTSNPAFWVLQGTPTSALELVTVARLDAPADEPPVEIYAGNIERQFDNVTETDPLNPSSRYVLVYLRPGILSGHRFWWLIEDVQPQFEVLNDAGINVYTTANFAAQRVFTVASGELVIVTGISPNELWFRIRSRRGSGWVPATILEEGFVRFLGDMDEVPTVFPTPLDQQPDGAPATPGILPTQDPGGSNAQPPTQAPVATNMPAPATNMPAPTEIPPVTAVPTIEDPGPSEPRPTIEQPGIPPEPTPGNENDA